MAPKQVVPVRVRVDLEVMVMKGPPHCPKVQNRSLTISWFSVISKTLYPLGNIPLVMTRVCVCCIQRKATTLMYKNVICFFSFPFITRNVRMARVRKGRIWLSFTHRGEMRIFSERLLIRSAFASLVQGHLMAWNHLGFYSLLDSWVFYNSEFSLPLNSG